MTNSPSFKVYNASAGAGKTYTLVREYVTTLLQLNASDAHRHLLAVTFTNKAVAEMKERVVSTLLEFSMYSEGAPSSMHDDIASALYTTPQQITFKAQRTLDQILNNYASFDIVTLDTLTHRILRTFSKDLGLSGNFEVTLDVKDLLQKAVDRLIDQTGSDEQLTETLISFALEKTNDDKSWNITKDLNDIAQLLVKENDRNRIADLGKVSHSDFQALQKKLDTDFLALKAKIESEASQLLATLTERQLEKTNFNRGLFYTHVENLSKDATKAKFGPSVWQSQIDNGSYSYYKTKEDDSIKDIIDGLRPSLDNFFKETKQLYYKMMLTKELSKKLIPLSLLRRIYQEVEVIKDEENILLISDFNEHIFKHLNEEPAAFIYERIGERYTHFFIDEFQDTSQLQWSNLIPLIDNTLSTEGRDDVPNSLMIVGDPKQAIYRWRGGKAEQFIDLYGGRHPFSISHLPLTLPKNYRSHREVIAFNNDFFSYCSQYFNNPTYKELYNTSSQEINDRDGGLVNISFINAVNNEEANELYPPRVLDIIQSAISDGFEYGDICVLTRKNSHGSLLASFLSGKNIKVISNDSLLIASSEIVLFIEDLLRVISQPDTPELTLPVLRFLVAHLNIASMSNFLEEHVHLKTITLFEALKSFNITFDLTVFNSLTLYEAVEYIIRAFGLKSNVDAYITAFLQVVLDFSHKKNTGLRGFLSYWDQKKSSLSIAVTPQPDALQLMSIHKSKGLEFPIVIYPYADTDLYDSRDYHWYPLEKEAALGFNHLLVGHKRELAHYSETGEALYLQRQEQQLFDAINVLYVALTRAVRRLYVVSRFRESAKLPFKNPPQTIADVFLSYLHEKEGFHPSQYVFTKGKTEHIVRAAKKYDENVLSYTSSPKEDHNLFIVPRATFLWNETRQEAITYGNLIHTLMAKLISRDQIDFVIQEAISEGLLPKSQQSVIEAVLEKVVSHEALSNLYNPENTVYCERALLTEEGNTFIPDRIEISPHNSTSIIDYKTGTPQENHKYQIENYGALLSQMGHTVQNKFLVYLNEDVDVLTA